MTSNHSRTHLRAVLLADALTCLAMGLVLTLAATQLASLTGIPPALLLFAGAALLPVASFMAFVALRALGAGWAVRLVIAGNVAWIAASVALLVGGWIGPNVYGQAFISAQALVVAILTVLEGTTWRRARRTLA